MNRSGERGGETREPSAQAFRGKTDAGAEGVLAAGERVAGRYVIESVLGHGGVASVYAAFDEQSGTRVALKHIVAQEGASGERTVALFQREYHTLAQISHPGIISVHEYGLTPAGPFYTMELLDGQDLGELAPLPQAEACRVLRDVAATLAILHARRIVHRDLSHRNVRLTRDGRAKLLDFGAMAPMGLTADLIGTPPFLSPEAVHGEPLDQRSDLYALGALAYFLLTGRHRYRAASIRELRALWKDDASLPPSAHVPDLAPALSQLVMALMQRDPMARPSSAAEVIDKLSGIGGLPRSEDAEVARSYLVNPKLIGREEDLSVLQQGLRQGLGGEGAVLLIEGPSGVGKTRLLQEAAVVAKLGGATVVQAAAASEAPDPYAVSRALLRPLLKLDGAAVEPSTEQRDALAFALPELAARPGRQSVAAKITTLGEQLARVQSALCAFVLERSDKEPLLLAIDDLHECDEESLALLVALSGELSGHRLVILGTVRENAPLDPALSLLLGRATATVKPQPLRPQQTERLVESLFGNPPDALRLAGWMQERARGNPLECLELARYLVDNRLAYYVDGAWMLPYELPAGVPRHLDESFRARVGALSALGRELAELLALCGRPVPLALCLELAAGAEQRAVFVALDQLVSSEIVAARGDAYTLSRDGIRQALLAELGQERARALHQRIGQTLAGHELHGPRAKVEAAYHMMRGSERMRGVELLEKAVATREALSYVGVAVVPALELALQICEAAGAVPGRGIRLRARLLTCAYLYDKRLLVHSDALLERLSRDSGIADVALASGANATERLTHCIEMATQRYQSLSEKERGLPPIEALMELGQALASTLAVAIFGYDLLRVRRLFTMVTPFAELDKRVPLSMVYELIAIVVDAIEGRTLRANARRVALFDTLSNTELYLGVDEVERKSVKATQLHALAMWEAAFDSARSLALADEIDSLGLAMYAGAAMQIRLLYHLYRGETRAAKACQVRMESLALQAGPGRQTEIWILAYLVAPQAWVGDVMALKRTVERLSSVVAQSPGYRPLLFMTLGAYYRTRNQLVEARTAFERSLQLTPRGQHAWWASTTGHYIDTLVACGDHGHALQLAAESFDSSDDGDFGLDRFAAIAVPPLAVAQASLGDCAGAAEKLDAAIARAEAAELPALRLFRLREARAQVAILSGDRAIFELQAHTLLERYRALDNPLLVARHLDLLDEAVRHGLIPGSAAREAEQANAGEPIRTLLQRRDSATAGLSRTFDAMMDL
ncbi:MAG: protein kinase [Polyangiales bacterium]